MTATVTASTFLSESDWVGLLDRIKDRKCTPLLGPSFAPSRVSLPGKLAKELLGKFSEFPFVNDAANLRAVAQYIASKEGFSGPQEELQVLLKKEKTDFNDATEPHRILANIPFPVYLTTNQNNFLGDALRANLRDARHAICPWWDDTKIECEANEFLGEGSTYVPSAANPLVYHLFGHVDMSESLVVTEDHHLEFLANVSGSNRIPNGLHQYFGGRTSLLFLGFRPDQLEFRVLMRSIVQMCRRAKHVAVQLFSFDEGFTEAQREEARRYLNAQFSSLDQDKLKFQICWGDCTEFLQELNRRWKEVSP